MNTTTKVIVWVVVIILVIWGISSMSKNGSTSSESIKIGFVGPLSGELANMGENARAAVMIAVEEINAAGGVLGKKIEVVYEDDLCTGATGANAMPNLVNPEKGGGVLGVVGWGEPLGDPPLAKGEKAFPFFFFF